VLDAEFGERVARRLAALVEPSFDRLMAKMEAVLAGIQAVVLAYEPGVIRPGG
jgi:hypothetical protein